MNTNQTTNDLTFAQAAFGTGMSPSMFSRLMKQKGFEGRRGGHVNSKLISRAEIAALIGVTLTDEQFAIAKQAKAPVTGKQLKARMAERAAAKILDGFDQG